MGARAAPLAVAIGIGLAVSGCSHGGDAATTGPVGTRSSAPPISTKKGATVSGVAFASRVSAAMVNAGSARFTVSSTFAGGTAAKGALRTAGTPGLSLQTTGGPALKLVILGGTVYVNPGQPQGGRHWYKLGSLTGALATRLIAPALPRLASSADVSSMTQGWSGAGTFAVGKTATVAGVRATEYDADLPSSAVLSGIRSELRGLTGGGVSDARVRVWLDAKSRPVRVSESMRLDGTPVTTSVTYSSWGDGPAVSAPKKSDVVGLPGL